MSESVFLSLSEIKQYPAVSRVSDIPIIAKKVRFVIDASAPFSLSP